MKQFKPIGFMNNEDEANFYFLLLFTYLASNNNIQFNFSIFQNVLPIFFQNFSFTFPTSSSCFQCILNSKRFTGMSRKTIIKV